MSNQQVSTTTMRRVFAWVKFNFTDPRNRKIWVKLLALTGILFVAVEIYIIRKNDVCLLLQNEFDVELSQDRLTGIFGQNSEKEIENSLTNLVRKMASGGNPVLVTMINDAYLPFTYSWLCNTNEMNIHEQVLIMVTDRDTQEKLDKNWPKVTTFLVPGLDQARGDQIYSQAGYVRLMIRRSEILLKILENDVQIFLFEVDCLWVTNPLMDLRKSTDVDIIVTQVSERPGIIAGGFLYMYPTNATKRLWRALTVKLLDLERDIQSFTSSDEVHESENDQEYISQLYHCVKHRMLSVKEYPDGKWYNYTESERMETKPFIINNNWVFGNEGKIVRAKKWGHWFLNDDDSCNMKQVAKITMQGP